MKVLFKREDGTFVVQKNGLPYHVLREDPLFNSAQLNGQNAPLEPALQPQPLTEQVRAQRNSLLQQSDWTQVADAPVDQAAWATYRQALRDITMQSGFPENVVWPTSPN